MKIPFSYKNSLFTPILAASFVGHVVFLGIGGHFLPKPEYAVQRAPSSVEIIILQDSKTPPKKETERVMTTEKPLTQDEVYQEEEKVEEETEIKKSMINPPNQGAKVEAQPDYLKNPAPLYPRLARQRGWEGIVLLKVFVQKDGLPIEVKIEKSSGHTILDQSAVRTIKEWKFLPARVSNMAFSSWVQIPVRFLLSDSSN